MELLGAWLDCKVVVCWQPICAHREDSVKIVHNIKKILSSLRVMMAGGVSCKLGTFVSKEFVRLRPSVPPGMKANGHALMEAIEAMTRTPRSSAQYGRQILPVQRCFEALLVELLEC